MASFPRCNYSSTHGSCVCVAHDLAYWRGGSPNCVAIALEIRELDEALGADLDAPVLDTKPSLVHKASNVATDQAVNAVQRTAQDLIPFRGWVRKLSGAERHSSHVSACIMAGSVRRAFLKGVAATQSCAWREVPASVDKT